MTRSGNTGNTRSRDATRRPSMLDIAWAAGIYEGEGTCALSSSNSVVVQVCQVGDWLPCRLQELFGGMVTGKASQKPSAQPQHVWQVFGPRAQGFLYTVFTFLGPRRRAQATKVLLMNRHYNELLKAATHHFTDDIVSTASQVV